MVNDGDYGLFMCSRVATVVRNGQHYCKQHDPIEAEARRSTKRSKMEKEMEAVRLENKQMREAWSILKRINPEDPLSVAKELEK